MKSVLLGTECLQMVFGCITSSTRLTATAVVDHSIIQCTYT